MFVTPLYPPRDPRPPFPAPSATPRRPLGSHHCPSRVPGAPGSPPGDPKDPPGTPQGLPRTPQGLPRASKDPLLSPRISLCLPQDTPGRSRYHPKSPPKLEIRQKPTFFQCFSKRPGTTQGALGTPQGPPQGPPETPQEAVSRSSKFLARAVVEIWNFWFGAVVEIWTF